MIPRNRSSRLFSNKLMNKRLHAHFYNNIKVSLNYPIRVDYTDIVSDTFMKRSLERILKGGVIV